MIRTRAVTLGPWGTLALSPTKPISYISYSPNGGDKYRFLVFDETTAEARTDDDWTGRWLAVLPDGKSIVAGLQWTYQSGTHMLDTGDRLEFIPIYESADELRVYQLPTDNGVPMFSAEKDDIGKVGTGIRLSADGKRVTYLSTGGSPRGSGCLSAWDPSDLSKLPVSFQTKGISTTNIAFHPTRPIAACCGSGKIAFFDCESGAQLDVDDVDLAGEKLGQAYFSPNGKSLLVERTVGPVVYLYRLDAK